MEGSINSVLEGRQYNRGIRLMKIVYEALSRLLHDSFITWLEEHHDDKLELSHKLQDELKQLHSRLSHNMLETLICSPMWSEWFKLYSNFKQILR